MVANNPHGMINGTYTGKYEEGYIKINAPMCGDITYLEEVNKLNFCGVEFVK